MLNNFFNLQKMTFQLLKIWKRWQNQRATEASGHLSGRGKPADLDHPKS